MSTKLTAALAAVALLLAVTNTADAAVPKPPGAPDGSDAASEFVPGQLLVRFDPGVDKAESRELADGQGAEVVERFAIVPRLALIDLPPGFGVEAAQRRFQRLDGVTSVEPNRVFEAALTPNDEFFTVKHYDEPHLSSTDWRLRIGGPVGAVVAQEQALAEIGTLLAGVAEATTY